MLWTNCCLGWRVPSGGGAGLTVKRGNHIGRCALHVSKNAGHRPCAGRVLEQACWRRAELSQVGMMAV